MRQSVGRVALFVLVPVLFLGIALPVFGALIAPSVPRWVGEHVPLCVLLAVGWCVLTATAWWLQRDAPPSAPDSPAGPTGQVTLTGSTLQQSPIIQGSSNRVTFGNDNRATVRKGNPHDEA